MLINNYDNTFGKVKLFVEEKHPKVMEKFFVPFNTFLIDRIFLNYSKKKAKELLSQKKFPLFTNIEIETINRCNGSCSFCPVNKYVDPRPFKLMDESLFYSIIDQLKTLNYSGSIGLYSNNEPLLDKRISELIKAAKTSLPNATLYIYTNGTLLTVEKFEEIIDYLDVLIIDNYNDNLELNERVKEIYEYASAKQYMDKVHIYVRKENEILTNRAGQAENRSQNSLKLKSVCMYPFEQMVVRSEGKVSLCCNDATGKMTLGDLNKESLQDIWNGEKLFEIRKNMAESRDLNPLCKECDTVCPKVWGPVPFKLDKYIKLLVSHNN